MKSQSRPRNSSNSIWRLNWTKKVLLNKFYLKTRGILLFFNWIRNNCSLTQRSLKFLKMQQYLMFSFLNKQFSRHLNARKVSWKWFESLKPVSKIGTILTNQKFGNSIWMNLKVTHVSPFSARFTWTNKIMYSFCLISCLDYLTRRMPKNGLILKNLQLSSCTASSRMYSKSKEQKPLKSESTQLNMLSTKQCLKDFILYPNSPRELKSKTSLRKNNNCQYLQISKRSTPKMITNSRLSKRKVSDTVMTVHQTKNGT